MGFNDSNVLQHNITDNCVIFYTSGTEGCRLKSYHHTDCLVITEIHKYYCYIDNLKDCCKNKMRLKLLGITKNMFMIF